MGCGLGVDLRETALLQRTAIAGSLNAVTIPDATLRVIEQIGNENGTTKGMFDVVAFESLAFLNGIGGIIGGIVIATREVRQCADWTYDYTSCNEYKPPHPRWGLG